MPTIRALLNEDISHNNKTKYVFSCLAAVQHWYDSDTTGQNENYGVMIRYYDETVEDYNSIYSADHTDATLRPAIVITYLELFAQYLRNGEKIIEAFFKAGKNGEAPYASHNHLQKVLYIPQALNETIYSPTMRYEYASSDVMIETRFIQGENNDDDDN